MRQKALWQDRGLASSVSIISLKILGFFFFFPDKDVCQVASVVSDYLQPHELQCVRLLCSWDSPGKNTGVGCHFLPHCMKVKSESEVTQSCPTLIDPMDCSLPGSSVHGFSRQEYWSGLLLPSPHWQAGSFIKVYLQPTLRYICYEQAPIGLLWLAHRWKKEKGQSEKERLRKRKGESVYVSQKVSLGML